MTRGVSCPDQGLVLLVSDIADPVELVFYMPVAAGPGGRGLRARAAVAGDQADDLDGLCATRRSVLSPVQPG